MRSIEPNTHTGNTMLTITGEKFGRDASAVEVHFIDTEESHCDVRSVSDTVIECYLTSTPAGVRRQVSVKIGNAGKQYNRSSSALIGRTRTMHMTAMCGNVETPFCCTLNSIKLFNLLYCVH